MGTVNLISDSGGFPEKRKGWRVLLNVEKPVNGLYRGIIKGKEYFLVHGGTRLYKWTENTLTELKSGLTNKQGTSFTLNDKMYVLTGGEYLGLYDFERGIQQEQSAVWHCKQRCNQLWRSVRADAVRSDCADG